MNKIIEFIICLLLIPVFGCDKSDDSYPLNKKQFYVKYEAKVTSRQLSNSIKYTVNTDDGIKTFKQGHTFTQTFGPVEEGFRASIRVDANFLNSADCEALIYVSRGEEPFALKKNASGGKWISIMYEVKE